MKVATCFRSKVLRNSSLTSDNLLVKIVGGGAAGGAVVSCRNMSPKRFPNQHEHSPSDAPESGQGVS